MMAPPQTVLHVGHKGRAHSQIAGDLVLAPVANRNGLQYDVRQINTELRLRKVKACRISPLGDHVSHIIGLRSEEQMVGVATGAHIAAMQDEFIFWDRAPQEFPRYNVGCARNAIDTELSVAGRAERPSPKPTASIRVVLYGAPESISQRKTLPSCATNFRWLGAMKRTNAACMMRTAAPRNIAKSVFSRRTECSTNVISHGASRRLFGQAPATRANGWSGPLFYGAEPA